MVDDIISTLDSKALGEFKKDFKELMRVSSGVNAEYTRLSKDIEDYLKRFNEAIDVFNKKYAKVVLKIKKTSEKILLRIFLKENSVKDVLLNVAAKLDGLSSIGASGFDKAKVEEADKFSKEMDKLSDKLFLSYSKNGAVSTNLSLKSLDGLVELNYDLGIKDENNPQFKICAYYAVQSFKDLDVHERLAAIGFLEPSLLGKVRALLKKFNPKIEE